MGPVNVSPYKRDFADVIKLMIMRWEGYRAYLGGPIATTAVFVSERQR